MSSIDTKAPAAGAGGVRSTRADTVAAILDAAAPLPKGVAAAESYEGMPVEPLYEGGIVLRPTHPQDRRIHAITNLRVSVLGAIEQGVTSSLHAFPVLPAVTRDTDVIFAALEGVRFRDQLPFDPRHIDPWQYLQLTLDHIAPTAQIDPMQRFIKSFRVFASGRALTGFRLPNSRAHIEVDHYATVRLGGPAVRPMKAPSQTRMWSLRRMAYMLHHTNALGAYRPNAGVITPTVTNIDPYWGGEMDGFDMWQVPWHAHPATAALAYYLLKRHSGQLSDGQRFPHVYFFGSDNYREQDGAAQGKGDTRVIAERLRLARVQSVIVEAMTLAQLPLAYACAWEPDVKQCLAYLRRTAADRDPVRERTLQEILAYIQFAKDYILSPILLDFLPTGGVFASTSGFEGLMTSVGDKPPPVDLAVLGEHGLVDLTNSFMAQATFAPNTAAPSGQQGGARMHMCEALAYYVSLIAGPPDPKRASGAPIGLDDEGNAMATVLSGLGFGRKNKRALADTDLLAIGTPLYDDGQRYTRSARRLVFNGWSPPSIPVVEVSMNRHPRGLQLEDAHRRARTSDLVVPFAQYTYGPPASGPGLASTIAKADFRPAIPALSVAIIPREESVFTMATDHAMAMFFTRGEHLLRTRKPDVDIVYDITRELVAAGYNLPPQVLDREIAPYAPGNIGGYWVPNESPMELRTHVRAWLLFSEIARASTVTLVAPTPGTLPPGTIALEGWMPYPARDQAPPVAPTWGPTQAGEIGELPWDRELLASQGVVTRLALCATDAGGGRHLALVSDFSDFEALPAQASMAPFMRWRNRQHRVPTLHREAIQASHVGGFLTSKTTRFNSRVVIAHRMASAGWRLAVEGQLPLGGIMSYDIEGPIGVPSSDATAQELLGIAAIILGVPDLRAAKITTAHATDRVAAPPPPAPQPLPAAGGKAPAP